MPTDQANQTNAVDRSVTPPADVRDIEPERRDAARRLRAKRIKLSWQAACSAWSVSTKAGEPLSRRARTTERVSHVSALAALGLSNKEIASELGVAESTISRMARPLALPSSADALRALESIRNLTASEREVLARAAAGESDEQIASARGSARRTVANQLRSAYEKLGIGSRRELRALLGNAGERKK